MLTNTGRFTLILGVQVVPVYSYIEPTTYYCIMRVAVKNPALPVYKTHYYASLKVQ